MTNGQAAAIGERVAVVETEVRHVGSNLAQVIEKIDLILEGQAEGKRDRADIRAKLEAMEPHVKTVADVKTGWRVLKWTGGAAGSVIAAWAYAKGLISLNLNWLMGRL